MGKHIGGKMIYKQELFTDPSQGQISWRLMNVPIRDRFFDNMNKYMYYPSSYAKNLFGWNVFDYLSEEEGDPLVGLTRRRATIIYSRRGTTDWCTRCR